jgi:chromosome segregation ATPase
VQKLIRKHAAECTRTNTATNEAMFKLQREKDSEIEALARHHHSQTQRLLHDFEYSEQRYKKQLSMLNEKIGVLKVDYPAYCGLKAEHQTLKHQLERHDAQSLVLQNMLQRYRDSKLQADAQLADASKQISQLRSDKAVHDGAVFQVFKLREMVHNLQTHLEGSKKETAETSRVLRRKEEAIRQLAGKLEQQSSEHDRLQSIKKDPQVTVESLKPDKDEVSQKNQVLEKENVECKQNIQNLQDRHAGFVVRLAKMRKMFTDTSAVLHKVDHQKENLQGEVEELKVNNKQLEKNLETATEAKASLETAFNNTINKLETAAEPSYYDFYNKLLKLDKTGKLSKEFRNVTSKRIDHTRTFQQFCWASQELRTPDSGGSTTSERSKRPIWSKRPPTLWPRFLSQ